MRITKALIRLLGCISSFIPLLSTCLQDTICFMQPVPPRLIKNFICIQKDLGAIYPFVSTVSIKI